MRFRLRILVWCFLPASYLFAEELPCSNEQLEGLRVKVINTGKRDKVIGRCQFEICNINPDIAIKKIVFNTKRNVYVLDGMGSERIYSSETNRYDLIVDIPPQQTRCYTLRMTPPKVPARSKNHLDSIRIEFNETHTAVCEMLPEEISEGNEEEICVPSHRFTKTVRKESSTDFENLKEVYARYKPKGREPNEWDGHASVSRSSSALTIVTETRWHDERTDEYLFSTYSWFTSMTICCGTIIALPNEDFKTEEIFTYKDGDVIAYGMLVSVEVAITNSGKSPSKIAKMRSVKNLCESGMAVPQGKGMPGRIISLKSAAKKRFGANRVEVYYDEHPQSRVKFLLLNCDESQSNPNIKPICYPGLSK